MIHWLKVLTSFIIKYDGFEEQTPATRTANLISFIFICVVTFFATYLIINGEPNISRYSSLIHGKMGPYNEISDYNYDLMLKSVQSASMNVFPSNDTLSYEQENERELVYKFGIARYSEYKHIDDSLQLIYKRKEIVERMEAAKLILKVNFKKDSVYSAYLNSKR